VTGIRYQSAQFQLKDAKLTSALTQKNSTKPKGIVIAQKPDSGKSVLQGTEVALVVSKGPSGVAMPDVTGMAAADAVKALAARKLVPTLQQVESQEAPGTVLAQSPTPGKHAKPGTKVILQVAKGHASISVPDVTGHSAQDAVNDLKTAGLSSSLARVPSSQPAGTVVAQNPAAGTKVAGGSAVRLNVATARATTTTQQQTTTATTTATKTTTPATTTKPPASGNDYTGMKLNDAVQQIADGRQQVIVQYVSSSGAAGVVVANSRSGSKERLQVSTGSKPKAARSVPDATGEDAQTAQQDMQSAGFTVIQVTWPVGDASSDGMVVYQAPSAGSSIPQGSAIVVYVGSASGG